MQTAQLSHPLHAAIEARLNAGSFDEAQHLLAQLGVASEHVHVTTYFATRILYQRGKLDLPGVVARLGELLSACPQFPEAEAMLRAAERGTLRPDPRSFCEATVPPVPEDEEQTHGSTDPGPAPSSAPFIEARLKTPQAPGIPRAPLVPRFTPRELAASYVPPARAQVELELDLELTPPTPEAELLGPESQPRSQPFSDTVSAPPPSDALLDSRPLNPPPSARGIWLSAPPAVAVDFGLLDGREPPLPMGERNTAPSPGAPGPPKSLEPPSLFSVATSLAEHDYERALSAIESLGGSSTSAELSLLEVRALIGVGRRAAARRALDRLCRAPLIDPELRAAAARLLIELGDFDRAEAQARRAHHEDPGSQLARLTLAWAVARSDAWLPSPRSAAELAELLSQFVPDSCGLPALGHALRGLMLMHSGALEAARDALETALSLDAGSLDALAVTALLALKQQRGADALRAYKRLLELDHHAADELAQSLEALGLAVGRKVPSHPTVERARPATLLWDPAEHELQSGLPGPARERFEQVLRERMDPVPLRWGPRELAAAASTSARWLTEAPVSRHFAPFDFSLFSIARLDAALSLLYQRGAGSASSDARARALLGLAAYVGECLRQAYAGEWVGSPTEPLRLRVEGQGFAFSPFRDVADRLQAGRRLRVEDVPAPQHPGAEPLGHRVALDVAPPTPWAPAPWPDPDRVAELGARLGESPVGIYCAACELPLDLSAASLRSIDRYVTLLAPPLAPPDPEEAWVRRAAVLVGAYVGESLCNTAGARWEAASSHLKGAEAYRLILPNGTRAAPIAAALERLSGRRLEQPSDYARRVTG